MTNFWKTKKSKPEFKNFGKTKLKGVGYNPTPFPITIMKKIKKLIFAYRFYLTSFFLPFSIMAGVYLTHGIYWGSETSPLLGDGFHQYVIFDTTLRNALHGTDSLFYTFSSGLGLNFYALSSYYLGSFLSPLVYFFDVQSMPDAVWLFTLVKFGLIGLSSFISIKGMFKKVPELLILSLSTCYALMSFATSQIEIKTWLDVFILVPLILYGLHQVVTEEKRWLYFISLSTLFIQNYYFGFMMVLFLPLWYLVQLSWDFKQRIKSFLDFTILSILAGLTSLIVILPTFLDLKTHGESLTTVDKIINPDAWYFDIFAKNLIGSFDTTKYGSIPMIYVGLVPLLFALVFFTLKSIKFHVKLAYFILLSILIASFWLQPLDLFWQGMHAPNMFLHRYSWLFSTLVVMMAAETVNRLSEIKIKHFLLAIAFLGLGFGLTFLFQKNYDFLSPINYILTAEFLVAYLLIFIIGTKRLVKQKLVVFAILFFSIFEISLNTFYQIQGISKEWVFSSRESYAQDLTEIDKLVNFANQQEETFFRMEKLTVKTGNDSMKYNYHGISQFSSVRNTAASTTLDKLGFKSAGTNLNLRYQNNTLLMDSLFGIHYNIAQQDPQKFGFNNEKKDGNLSLYHNKYANQLAFLTNESYKDVPFTALTLDNQTNFINQITGLNLKYFNRITPNSEDNVKHVNQTISVSKDPNLDLEAASASYTLTIPASSQLYVTLPNLNFTNQDSKKVDITVNGKTLNYTTDNVFPFFNIGFFNQEQEVSLRISFPENSQVSYGEPQFYRLDLNHYQKAMEKIQEQAVTVKHQGAKLDISYQAQRDTSLLITLPYDQGWTAWQDGQNIPISRAQNGLMKVEVKQGKGQIHLTFLPQGFKFGAACFIIGIVLFLLYDKLQRRRKQLRLYLYV